MIFVAFLEKILKRKSSEDLEIEKPNSPDLLPNELEQFRLSPPKIEEKPSPFGRVEEKEKSSEPFIPHDIMERNIAPKEEKNFDKIDLILSKLETIDARLRLIEEKIKH